ncbi:MAG: S8 family serine peptidase [Caldilineaceae bacterium]|nr:S8 family serine peptidase [Caldilineaceae bacterium]
MKRSNLMLWVRALLSVLVAFIVALGPFTVASTSALAATVPDTPVQAAQDVVAPGYVQGKLVVKLLPTALSSQESGPQAEQGAAAFHAIDSLNSLNSQYEVTEVSSALAIAATDETAKQQGLDRIFILAVPPDTDIWQMAAAYASDPHVQYAEPSIYLTLREPLPTEDDPPEAAVAAGPVSPNDPYFSEQDNLYNTGQSGGSAGADVNAPSAWELETGSASTVIAIVDTGINPEHPDLQGKVLTELGYDFVENDLVPQDTTNHGTRVAGVIAANSNNGVGIAGMCWGCQLLPLRVGTSVIHLASVEVAQAIYYAATLPVDVINMSLGGQCSELWADVVNYAYARDVVMVAAAGNLVDFVVYPARFDPVIAVSAVNRNDQFADFSSFGPEVDVAAPGANILVTDILGGIRRGSGTSYASAIISGIVGLLRSENPDLTNSEIRQILRDSALDLGRPGFDRRYGYGRVNARLALEEALEPPAAVESPASARCGCILGDLSADLAPDQDTDVDAGAAAGEALQQPAAVSALDTLYRVRDELFATSAFGQEITALYYRHSPQVAYIAFQDAEFRSMLKATLETGIPYAMSALNGDGEQIVDQEVVDHANALVAELAAQANPELRDDLRRVWQAVELEAFVGQPVHALIEHLGQLSTIREETELRLPLVVADD